jgi:hypothetical protein
MPALIASATVSHLSSIIPKLVTFSSRRHLFFKDDKKPITSIIVAEKAMGERKMRTAARLMHSTTLCQPDPAKSQAQLLLLLDSYWADRKAETEL